MRSVQVPLCVLLSASIAGCSDYDNGYDTKSLSYERTFISQMGDPDPDQDWSMASHVTVSVNLPSAPASSRIEVFSDAPIYATSTFIASGSIGDTDLAFDVNQGAEQVYAVVRDGKQVIVEGFYDVEDGKVNITDTPMAKKSQSRAKSSRAGEAVTKGEVKQVGGLTAQSETEFSYWYNWQRYTLEALREWAKNNSNLSINYYEPFNSDCIVDGKLDFTNATVNTNLAPLVPAEFPISVTYLNGVEKSAAAPWKISDGSSIFGYQSFFMEQEYYYGKKNNFDKTTLYGDTQEQKLATLQKIEKGFSITTTGGKIEIPFIYGATWNTNQFGYVYYKEGQDPLSQPHYILIKDARPQSNIYKGGWQSSGNAVGGMQLANWSNQPQEKLHWDFEDDDYIYGTKYCLSFFGENHDQTASYTFPAGYHIVFFICPVYYINSESDFGDFNSYNFHYSLPDLNRRIKHYYWNTGSPTYSQGDETSRGAVKAAAWKAGGVTMFGFEDGGGDEDLNDIVFWAEGDFTPDDDIVKIDVETTNESETWIMACEDLGGSYDYDFNDIVWEVRKDYEVSRTTKVENGVTTVETVRTYRGGKVRLMAAGGTLPAEIIFDYKSLGEVHQLFGQPAKDVYNIVNVGGVMNVAPVNLSIDINENDDINSIARRFAVRVQGNEGEAHYVTAPSKGTVAPQIIILPGDWEWPQENMPITTAYPNFTKWVVDAKWSDWSQTWDATRTVKRSAE